MPRLLHCRHRCRAALPPACLPRIQSPDLAAAVHLLPVRIEAPHAWQTLADGMAAHGGRALRAALSPRRYPVPSYAAASLAPCRCQLAGGAVGRRFRARPLNLFLALLFDQVPAAVVLAGLPPVHLNRWDLHHAHIFLAPSTGQLGLLLHAREFPAACAERFPVDLGHCQRGSPLEWDDAGMDHRNLLWIHGTLACLDVSAPQLAPLLMPGLEVPRTVLEHDLGRPLADVFYLAQLRGRKPAERVFVCVPGDV